MKGIQFYIEFDKPSAKRKASIRQKRLPEKANCIAIFKDLSKESLMMNNCLEGLGAIFYHLNSEVTVTGIHPDYLRKNCTRCSEQLARELHPRLFDRLDD